MAFRQASGIAMQRLCSGMLQSEAANSNKLLWNAAFSSSRAVAAETGAEAVTSGYLPAAVPQFSSSVAAALAAKRANLVPGGSLKPTGMFSFTRSAHTSASPVAAAVAAGEQAKAKSASMMRRLGAVAAALMAALGLSTPVLADSPHAWAYGPQDTASSTAQAMIDLHHDIMFFVIAITIVVFYMVAQFGTKFHYSRQLKPEKLTHHTTMEVIWTVIPTLIVVLIAIPSLTLIYSMDQHTDRPGLTVKVIGRQWYWSYEMHDHLQQKLLDPDRLVALAEKSVLKA